MSAQHTPAGTQVLKDGPDYRVLNGETGRSARVTSDSNLRKRSYWVVGRESAAEMGVFCADGHNEKFGRTNALRMARLYVETGRTEL